MLTFYVDGKIIGHIIRKKITDWRSPAQIIADFAENHGLGSTSGIILKIN